MHLRRANAPSRKDARNAKKIAIQGAANCPHGEEKGNGAQNIVCANKLVNLLVSRIAASVQRKENLIGSQEAQTLEEAVIPNGTG